MDPLLTRASELDARDPLAPYLERFLPTDLVAYLDGNSLGRPLRAAGERLSGFVAQDWGGRLIRGWDEGWMSAPEDVGDHLARVALGAAPGQVVVADSTTVLLYKLLRAAVDARPGRPEVVVAEDDFPTDRYVVEGVAAERGLVVRWAATGSDVPALVGPATSVVVVSHVSYLSGRMLDLAALAAVVHDAGALLLADLCHSVGVVPLQLDRWGVDLAVGCTYKYLNGGPGSPAFAYAAADLALRQPIWGWMGRDDPFTMGPGYRPAPGVRQLVSGTPPVLAMVPLRVSLELLEEVGLEAVRAKSVALTSFALELADAWLGDFGVTVASPREPAERGGHITLCRKDFQDVTTSLWERGVVPDFRHPDGIRIGLSPLSTSFSELYAGMSALRELVGE